MKTCIFQVDEEDLGIRLIMCKWRGWLPSYYEFIVSRSHLHPNIATHWSLKFNLNSNRHSMLLACRFYQLLYLLYIWARHKANSPMRGDTFTWMNLPCQSKGERKRHVWKSGSKKSQVQTVKVDASETNLATS